MNANELANEIDKFLQEAEQLPWGTKQVYLDQSATMLRQLQAENEALKANFNKENPVKEVFNKPVAYLHTDGSLIKVDPRVEIIDPDFIPLYTHSVKEPTEDEIEEFAYAFQLWQLHNPDKRLEGIMAFAKAILRKAQKKVDYKG